MSTDDPERASRRVRRRSLLTCFGGLAASSAAGCLGGDESAPTAVEFTTPETVSLDEPFPLEIRGLPGDTVDVRVSLTDYEGVTWTARETYDVTDGTVTFDTSSSGGKSVEGGLMALVQRATTDDSSGYFPSQDDGDEVVVSAVSDGNVIGSTTIDRTFDGVPWRPVDSDAFVGWVSEPPGEGPAPGIVVLHGSEGYPSRGMAQLLAANGFVTLGLHYFDPSGRRSDLPSELFEVPLEYVEAGANWLLEHDRVEGTQVGAWGVSRGGELALLAGSRFETIGAVVSLNGSGYIWAGPFSETELNGGSSWTVDGEPVPYVPYTTDLSTWNFADEPVELEPGFTASAEEADEETLDAATIPVEAIDGPVLLVSGGDDRMWDSTALHDVAASRRESFEMPVEHLVYEDAGHSIWYPYLPATNRTADDEVVYGGTTEGYMTADVDHWPRVIEAFESFETN